MKISVDMDGVLIDCIPAVIEVIKRDYGITYLVTDIDTWDFLDKYNLDKHYLDIFTSVGDLIMDFPIVDENAPKILRILSAKHNVDIVTGDYAPMSKIQEKLDSIGICAGVHYDAIIRTHESKTDLDYDVFIDDKPSMANELKENQILYLYDQLWNKDVKESQNVIRVYNWEDILWSI